jgi:hypothetical protein
VFAKWNSGVPKTNRLALMQINAKKINHNLTGGVKGCTAAGLYPVGEDQRRFQLLQKLVVD